MAKVERMREVHSGLIDLMAYLRERTDAGWKLVAVEWQRQGEGGEKEARKLVEDVPFGLRVSEDCAHLEEDPTERQILTLMMDLIVDDYSLSKVADELNRKGYRTRTGRTWGPAEVFNMLPRLIEVGPRIFSSEDWEERRRRLSRMSADPPAGDRRVM